MKYDIDKSLEDCKDAIRKNHEDWWKILKLKTYFEQEPDFWEINHLVKIADHSSEPVAVFKNTDTGFYESYTTDGHFTNLQVIATIDELHDKEAYI